MPRVAVIIPTFNRAHLLERAVRSVLTQTFRDFECVVVDDGSTDATASLSLVTESDPRLRYCRHSCNRGVAAARNTGIRMTTAPLLAFLDSDDEWKPRKLERQVAWLDRNPSFAIVQSREIWIRRGKRVNPPKTHEKFQGDLFAASLERCMITPSSVLMTRTLFNECGPWNETLPACEDYDLWLRITNRYPVGLVDEYLLIRFGGHADQLSATVPLLDRYRIASLQDLLASGRLSEQHTQQAAACLVKRARIVAQGFLKRNNRMEYERYTGIIRQWDHISH